MMIHEFQKNAVEIVRVEIKEFRDQDYLNIRVWFEPDNSNEYKPSPKGITLNVDLLPELKKAILKAEKQLKTGLDDRLGKSI
jgi:hypothetical protein